MMLRVACLFLTVLAGSAWAQQQVSQSNAVMLRGLDKVNGQPTDIQVSAGQVASYGRLQIELGECRYPAGNPAGNAYAYLVVRENDAADPVFAGWMVASSPALNPLDHARYDVWVLRCVTS